ncbi:MAG: DUF1499 domain-containing protein [Rubrivivax sp.]|nr:DUF1499 domain-containing protein [Rubrivivax sp.]
MALVLAAVGAGQLGLLRGQPPAGLGVKDGRLAAPSTTPNSVSSQAELWPGHPQQASARIAPLAGGAATFARLQGLVSGWPGARIVEAREGYLRAEFTTPLMKYTDDVEFWLDPSAGVVHVRSASRLGHGDMGANRRRVEALRARLLAP